MKLVYVAGPIRARTYIGMLLNVYRGWKAARELWREGFSVICPHMNTLFLSEWQKGYGADVTIAGDLEQLGRCDAVLFLDGWQYSLGASQEYNYLLWKKIPCFFTKEDLIQWAKLSGKEN